VDEGPWVRADRPGAGDAGEGGREAGRDLVEGVSSCVADGGIQCIKSGAWSPLGAHGRSRAMFHTTQ
jgi:hypothetical protein